MKEYEVIETKRIAELSTDATVLRHKKSGARIFTMKNDDDNKVFSIAFRTPAEDSTGVAHITEHSVLCGSEKFPLKDPFVELAKGSLNTFLNAMTYPDKTVYPVASTNDKDFDNLMDVYMDAVLHPNCLKDERILKQEGWHYELADKKGKIEYNGVVYNEMKGAFSSPDAVLERYTLHALYPDTTYASESGGDPEVIPELTFEKFKAFHDRFYHPSNSYIILYGNIDMEKKLQWLDEKYLSEYTEIKPNSDIEKQTNYEHMREEEISYPIGAGESLDKNTYLSLNFSIGDNLSAKQNLAFSILDDALLSTPGAPLKQALLDAGIGTDVYGGYNDGINQPYFSIVAKNAEKKDKKRFLKVIKETLKKLAKEGLDHKTILASIHHDEFVNREADYGRTPKGLIYALTAMDAWLYGGKPWTHLETDEYFKELRRDTDKRYFENLIETYLIDNAFQALVTVRPERKLTEKRENNLKAKLAKYKKSLSSEEIDALVKETEELKIYQDTPTSQEDLKKLPLLSRKDIRKDAEKIEYTYERAEGTGLLFTEKNTRGIAYLRLNFNTACLTEDELPYVGLLRYILAYMDSANHTYQDLSSEIYLHTGGMNFDVTAYTDLESDKQYTGIFYVDTKIFYKEMKTGLELIEEILHTTKYEDKKRMMEILNEAKSKGRSKIEGASHVYAMGRAVSYFSASAAFLEKINGISYEKFIDDLQKHYEERSEEVTTKLTDIANKIFKTENMFISITSEKEGKDTLKKLLPQWKDTFAQKEREEKFLSEILRPNHHDAVRNASVPQVYVEGNKNEGFYSASQVNYVARAGRYDIKKHPYTGSLRVLKMILNYEYLWLNLRVKGGAYGCMSGFARGGEGYLVSYRDPHLKETIDIYEKLPEYLEKFKASERDMTKYIIGAISELDTPKTNYGYSTLTLSAFLSGITNEMLQKERDELLATTNKDICALSDYIKEILATGASVVIGNAASVKDASDSFYTVEELFKDGEK